MKSDASVRNQIVDLEAKLRGQRVPEPYVIKLSRAAFIALQRECAPLEYRTLTVANGFMGHRVEVLPDVELRAPLSLQQ